MGGVPEIVAWRGAGVNRSLIVAVAWCFAYLTLVCAPLLLLPTDSGGPFAWNLAIALGYGGLAIMGLQFALTARFRGATAPFGIDVIYFFHRWVAVGGLVLLIGHWGVFRVYFPTALGVMDPRNAPVGLTAGRIALLLFATVIASSLWRKRIGLEYDLWRLGHIALAIAAVVLSAVHVRGSRSLTESTPLRWLWIGYGCAWIVLVAYVRFFRPWRLLRTPYRVTDVREERGSAWTLTLVPESHSGLTFRPGQFAWLTLRASPFAAREHPFSFSGSAADIPQLSFTIKELGDFSGRIGTVAVGERAFVDGPHGVFTIDRHPDAPGFVFVVGGVGVAPIMSMLRTLADREDPRPLQLIYANVQWDAVLFREELAELADRLDLSVTHVLERPPADWDQPRGRVSAAILDDAIRRAPSETVFFVCGPERMNDVVQRLLHDQDVPLRRVHSELFDMV